MQVRMFPVVPLTCSLEFPTVGNMPAELPELEVEERRRVGATLRTLRELRGYKPDEFASEIGISRPYLANIEAGRKKLTNVLLARAAAALEVEQIAIMRAVEAAA